MVHTFTDQAAHTRARRKRCPRRGSYSILTSAASSLNRHYVLWRHGSSGPICLNGDLRQVVGRKLDLDRHLVGVLDQANAQLQNLEQATELIFGCVCEVQREDRQGIEQGDALLTWLARVGLVGSIKLGDERHRFLLLRFQFVVATAQSLRERICRVTVLRLTENGRLAAIKVGKNTLQPFPVGTPSLRNAVVEPAKVFGEDLPTTRPKDPLSYKPRHRVKDG